MPFTSKVDELAKRSPTKILVSDRTNTPPGAEITVDGVGEETVGEMHVRLSISIALGSEQLHVAYPNG